MTTTKNNEHKKLNFSSEREQSQVCLNSAEHEKNQGRKVLNVPNLRFPEFQGEWEKSKLSDLCTFFSGGTPSSSNKDFYGGDIAFIRSGELHANSTELFITQDGYDNSSAKKVEIGDLLLAMYGATSGDIAVSKIRGAINQAILCIRTNQNKKFIESVWNKHVSKILRKYLQGGQGNLSADIVKGISFSFPTLEEQERIANLISLLDERIATQNKIIDKLQSLIKGIVDCTILRKEKVYLNSFCFGIHITNTEVAFPPFLSYYVSSTAFRKFIYPYAQGSTRFNLCKADFEKASIKLPTLEKQKRIYSILSHIDSKIETERQMLDLYNSQKQYLLRHMFI